MVKTEKLFLALMTIIALILVIISLTGNNSLNKKVGTYKQKNNEIYTNIKIINFNKSFTLEKINLKNEQNLISSLYFKYNILNIPEEYILNSLPRIKYLLKIKKQYSKEVITRFPWEIPLSQLEGIKFGEPIKNFYFRNAESVYPGAIRYYRHGIHRGIDFSDLKNGTIAKTGEPVYAVYPGEIVKIKNSHKEFKNQDLFIKFKLLSRKYYYTHDDFLDFFRGNQVYIRSGNFFFIYAHLDSVSKKLTLGQYIKKGELLGFMGNTGVEYMGVRPHLHLEIYFGNFVIGLNRYRRPFKQSLEIYKQLFSYDN